VVRQASGQEIMDPAGGGQFLLRQKPADMVTPI